MEFFADTANIDEIQYCSSQKVNDGITTNPKIMESTGELSLGFEGACKRILQKYPAVPISLETDLRGVDVAQIDELKEKVRDVLLKQAYALADWAPNVVVKIPICEGGLLAVKELSQKGIKTNVTACMTPYQALKAAEAGATYVSLFANRMLDAHILSLGGHALNAILINPDWKNLVQENKENHTEEAWGKTMDQIAYVAETLEEQY